MNELERNLASKIITAIAEKRKTLPEIASPYEAFAIIKDKTETADAAANMKKCVDHFWEAVKEKNEDAAAAYASQLANDARRAAVAFAELAAYAEKAADL